MSNASKSKEAIRFAAILKAAENKERVIPRQPRVSAGFIPSETVGTFGSNMPQSSAYVDAAVESECFRASYAISGPPADTTKTEARLNLADIIVLLKSLVEKAKNDRDLRRIRVQFAKGFHPDRLSNDEAERYAAFMREANAIIDAAIRSRRI